MQTKRILEKAAAKPADRVGLRRTATYIVRDLRTRSLETLSLSRRDVSRSAETVASDEFAAGYMTALGDVLAAFEAQLSQDLERAADVRVAERPGFAEVLGALANGHAYPRQIADATPKHDYEVSRILKDLRELGLAEQRLEPTDKRRRPHHLTARGDAVAAALSNAASDEPVAPVATSVELFAALQSGSSRDELSLRYDDAVVDAAATRLAELLPDGGVFGQMAKVRATVETLTAQTRTVQEQLGDMPAGISVAADPAASSTLVASAAPLPSDD